MKLCKDCKYVDIWPLNNTGQFYCKKHCYVYIEKEVISKVHGGLEVIRYIPLYSKLFGRYTSKVCKKERSSGLLLSLIMNKCGSSGRFFEKKDCYENV